MLIIDRLKLKFRFNSYLYINNKSLSEYVRTYICGNGGDKQSVQENDSRSYMHANYNV